MLASELIQKAYRYAEILAEEGENATATQEAVGLDLLNLLIDMLNINGSEISLVTTQQFTLTAGVGSIDIPGFVKLLRAQYLNGSIWQDTTLISLEDYRNDARISSSGGIPYLGYAKRTASGFTISLFFPPDSPYTFRVDGYKGLTKVALTDDIQTADPFYESVLLYFLAQDLRDYYHLDTLPFLDKKVSEISDRLGSIKNHKINIRLSSIGRLGQTQGIIGLNLGRGYTPT